MWRHESSAPLAVEPTTLRERVHSRGDYVGVVARGAAPWVRGSHYAALEPHVDRLAHRVHCKVIIDDAILSGTIRVDQTLRIAVGVAVGQTVVVRRLHRTALARLTDFMSNLGGKRDVVLVVRKARPLDMEKRLVRMRAEVLTLLGCEPGDFVVLRSIVEADGRLHERRLIRRAVALNGPQLREEHSTGGPTAEADVQESDLRLDQVLVDQEGRECLQIESGQAVTCRRDTGRLLRKEFLEVGIFLALALLALNQVFPDEPGYWIPAVVLAVTAFVLVVRVRSSA